jgi:hypothetical protein
VVQAGVAIEADVTDNVRVVWVEFYVDGGLYKVLWHTMQSVHPYTIIWSTWELMPGSAHTVYVKAYDLAGNVSVSPTIHVTIKALASLPVTPKITTVVPVARPGVLPLAPAPVLTASSTPVVPMTVVQNVSTTTVSTTTVSTSGSKIDEQEKIIQQLQQEVLELLKKIIAALEERLRALKKH